MAQKGLSLKKTTTCCSIQKQVLGLKSPVCIINFLGRIYYTVLFYAYFTLVVLLFYAYFTLVVRSFIEITKLAFIIPGVKGF